MRMFISSIVSNRRSIVYHRELDLNDTQNDPPVKQCSLYGLRGTKGSRESIQIYALIYLLLKYEPSYLHSFMHAHASMHCFCRCDDFDKYFYR